MDRIKIIFFDIDGTLIDMNKKHITDTMLDTLVQLQKKGIILCIATGRTPVTVPHFEGVEFDAFLTFNGSYCYNKKEVIYGNPIPNRDVHKIIENAQALGRPVSIATKDRLTANGRDEDLVEYYAFAKIEVEVTEDFDEVADGEIYQIMLGCTVPERERLMQGVEHARITAWWDRAVDVIPADGGKGVGVKKMLAYYGFDQSEAMAFGDGNNDIEMLQAVGHGVAMANASDDLKAIADDLCGDVAEEGIYHYCKLHNLI